MIISGSYAIKEHFPDFPREPKDIDIIRQYKEFIPVDTISELFNNKKVEILENEMLEDLDVEILDPNTLCTLKASHLCWDINWRKHMWDLQFLLKKGCKIDNKLFFELYNYWNKVHGNNKRSDLKMSKLDFFKNAVNYDELEHDETHKLINPIPIYTKVLKDNCEVELDENKFLTLSYEEKLDFIREEVYVMAYERFKKLPFREAYDIMLKKFIISHVPLFALIFTLENYIILSRCQFNFIKKIEEENVKRK